MPFINIDDEEIRVLNTVAPILEQAYPQLAGRVRRLSSKLAKAVRDERADHAAARAAATKEQMDWDAWEARIKREAGVD